MYSCRPRRFSRNCLTMRRPTCSGEGAHVVCVRKPNCQVDRAPTHPVVSMAARTRTLARTHSHPHAFARTLNNELTE